MENRLRVVKSFFAIIIASIHFIPLFILVNVAFKRNNDFTSRWSFPRYFTFENFIGTINEGRILIAFRNSIIITFTAVIVLLFISSIAAYPLARVKGRFSQLVMNIILGVMMIPSLSVLVPLYDLMLSLGAINTLWGIALVLVTYNLPLAIFLYKNFISSIHTELDDAAAIDGCNKIQTFFKVIFPQLLPVTSSVVILSGIKIWNDYRFALYFLQNPENETITLFISKYFAGESPNLNTAAAAAVLAIIPVVIVFIAFQKYFISGLSEGAVK